jgi:hypothetical protein
MVVFVELWAIAWIQNRYMETPFLRATFQVVLGGALVFAAGVADRGRLSWKVRGKAGSADEFEPVSTRTVIRSLLPRRDRATRGDLLSRSCLGEGRSAH